MRTLAIFTCLLLSAVAQAGTLADTLCGINAVCHAVPNGDGAAPIDYLQYDWAHGRVLLSTGGKIYNSGLYALPNGVLTWSYLPLVSDDGHIVYLGATFRTWATVSGRTRLTHWELTSGSVSP